MSDVKSEVRVLTSGPVRETVDKLKKILTRDLGLHKREDEIDQTTELIDGGLALDSVVTAEFITHIEGQLDFQFDDADMNHENFKDVGTLARLIVSRRNSTVE